MLFYNLKTSVIFTATAASVIFILATGGCRTATKPISFAGNIAVKTVEVSGKVAAQGVKTTGKVVGEAGKTGIKTAGELAKTGTKTTADVAKHQVVYIKDVATGTLKEVPWKEGLSLYMAIQTGNISPYLMAYTIYRNGGEKVIKTDSQKIRKEDVKLNPGDYVEVKKVK